MSDLGAAILGGILDILAVVAAILVWVVMAIIIYGAVFVVWFILFSLVLYPFHLEPVVISGNSFSWPIIGGVVFTMLAFVRGSRSTTKK